MRFRDGSQAIAGDHCVGRASRLLLRRRQSIIKRDILRRLGGRGKLGSSGDGELDPGLKFVGVDLGIRLGQCGHRDPILPTDGMEGLVCFDRVKRRRRTRGRGAFTSFVRDHEHLPFNDSFIRHPIKAHDVSGTHAVIHRDAPQAVSFSHRIGRVWNHGWCLGRARFHRSCRRLTTRHAVHFLL